MGRSPERCVLQGCKERTRWKFFVKEGGFLIKHICLRYLRSSHPAWLKILCIYIIMCVCVSDFSPWIIAYHCQVYEYGRTCNHVYVNRVFFLVSTEGPTGSVATTPLVGHKNSCTHLYTFVLNGWAFTKKNWLYHQQCDMWFCPRLEDTSIYVSNNMCFLTMRFGVHDLRTKSYHCDSAPNMICVRVCLHINCSRMRSDHGCMHDHACHIFFTRQHEHPWTTYSWWTGQRAWKLSHDVQT